MAEKQPALCEYAQVDGDGEITLRFPKPICGDKRLLRRLHARVGELLTECGLDKWIVGDMEVCLHMLSGRVMCQYVNNMFREVIAAEQADRKRTSAPSATDKPKASTKTARKRKTTKNVKNGRKKIVKA